MDLRPPPQGAGLWFHDLYEFLRRPVFPGGVGVGETTQGFVVAGDGTSGRVLREIFVFVANGTNANTLKVTVTSAWNGDAIAETNNVAKGATTGNFTLDAGGKNLTIEAAGLTGNAVAVLAKNVEANGTGGDVFLGSTVTSNDLVFWTKATTGKLDMTVLVDTGIFAFYVLYLTDA